MDSAVFKFGLSKFTKSPFTNIQEYLADKSSFGTTTENKDTQVAASVVLFVVVLGIAFFVLAWIGMGKIFKGDSEKMKNARIVGRIMLFLSGGSLTMLTILLWVCGVKFGDK